MKHVRGVVLVAHTNARADLPFVPQVLDGVTAEPEVERPPGIYLLPNLLTTGALFSGFYAIVAAINGQFVPAVTAVFVAGLFDGLDGRVARMTNTQSEFGVQYDSLSDLISFGLAPALVVYMWALPEALLPAQRRARAPP